MLYILDTNAITDMVNEIPKMIARFDRLPSIDVVATCTVVRGETLFGIERLPLGKKRRGFEDKARKVLAGLPCHAVVEATADQYARIKHACRRKGLPLDENDLWIAATALALDAVLVTRDTDFARVDGLKIEDWAAG